MGGLARAHDPERGGYRFGGWQPETLRSADQLAATESFFRHAENARLFFGTDRRCSSDVFALSRHRAFLRLNNDFSLFNRHLNNLVGNMRNF